MKTLEERLEYRKDAYEVLVKQEYHLEELYKKFSHLVERVSVTANVYDSSINIHISPPSIESAELTFIPDLSEIFDLEWDKRVLDGSVIYEAFISEKDSIVYFNINPLIERTCQFLKIPTGKTHKVSKYVEIDEPEYEIVIDCGGEAKDA